MADKGWEKKISAKAEQVEQIPGTAEENSGKDVNHKEIQTAQEMVKSMSMQKKRFTNMGLHPPDQQAIRPVVFKECVS